MKPEPKDNQEQKREQRENERKKEERTAEASPEDEHAFRSRVGAIIDRYRPALKKLAE